MHRALLITRPNYDYTTRYLYSWAGKVKDFAESRGEKVLDLKKTRANRNELESMIVKTEPAFLFLNGHGNESQVTGQDGEVLVNAGENSELFQSKVVYALACRSAKELGKRSVDEGAVAYIGYDEDFIFMYTEEKRTRPTEDATAGMFWILQTK